MTIAASEWEQVWYVWTMKLVQNSSTHYTVQAVEWSLVRVIVCGGLGGLVSDEWRLGALLPGFLPARRSKRGTCYANVAGWLGGCHTPVLYQNG